MNTLEEYNTLTSKKEYFADPITIADNCERLSTVIGQLSKQKNLLFRGVSEAKYKLYTSGQREFIQRDYSTLGIQYEHFMKALLDNLKQNNDLMEFCSVANIHPNDSYCFTYLQHYGAPTPYIDFTTDIHTALFFSLYHMSSYRAKAEIDQYSTLYYVECSNVDYITKRYEQKIAYKDSQEGRNKIYHSKFEENLFKRNMLRFDNLQEMDVFYIDSKRKSGVFNNNNLIFRIPNRNMLAQKGVLLYNSSDSLPLEKRLGKKIHCIHIHKSLSDAIKQKYLCATTYDRLFPNENSIAENAYANFRKTLLTK